MQKNEIIRLRIEELNHLGNGLAHACNADGSRGIAVFVQNAVPGDLVDARVIKVNKNYLVARIERLLEPSPMRIEESFCA
ncbi:MAG: TRAM domain-containing protein, partial [Clostridia bacterium]|nr:TRAM domain-containing protein [Clostridia bacterium]